jgi:hypothetical protein
MNKQEEIDFEEDIKLYEEIQKLRHKKDKIVRKSNKKLNKKLSPIEKEIYDKESELFNICKHRKTKKHYKYVEGGYLHTGTATTTWTCIYCNCIVDSQVTNTGYA